MEQTSAQSSQYVITARAQGDVIQQTRTRAVSAVVLAIMLKEQGYTVEVLDPMGNVLSSERAREGIAHEESSCGSTR